MSEVPARSLRYRDLEHGDRLLLRPSSPLAKAHGSRGVLGLFPNPLLIISMGMLLVMIMVGIQLYQGNIYPALETQDWETGGASVLETLSPPRVALLFLTRRDVSNEVAWRELLGADAEPAPEPAGAGDDAGLSTAAAALPWQVLFALHTHPEPGWEFPEGSLFHGTEVPGRGQVQWGRHSMMTAEKRLLAAALADPRSQRFAFFSESCIPLWPRHTLYFALMAESRSNLDAHAKPNVKTHQHYHMTYRRVLGYISQLEAIGVPRSAWRKSSQWISLNRKHAQLIVDERKLDAVFEQHCYPHDRVYCISDEHYVPTVLAFHGLAEETTGRFSITFTQWHGNSAHPRSWTAADATAERLAEMRGEGCESQDADAVSAALLHFLHSCRSWQLANMTDPEGLYIGEVIAAARPPLLPGTCNLAARKIQPPGQRTWAALLAPEFERDTQLAENVTMDAGLVAAIRVAKSRGLIKDGPKEKARVFGI